MQRIERPTDSEIVLELSELADETTRVANRVAELAMRLDHLVGLVGERIAPETLAQLDEQDVCEFRTVCR